MDKQLLGATHDALSLLPLPQQSLSNTGNDHCLLLLYTSVTGCIHTHAQRASTHTGVFNMKSLIRAVIVASVLTVPALSFAQSSAPLTRAQVRGELVQLQQAGYNTSVNDPDYPTSVQAAESRVGQQGAAAQAQSAAYGASANGTVQSGNPAATRVSHRVDPQGVFFGQ
jgi:Domain of unknown function (DUF4148)